MNTRHFFGIVRLNLLVFGVILMLSTPEKALARNKGSRPPTPTPTPVATPTPAPTPTPSGTASPTPTPSAAPTNTSRASSPDTTIDNRFVTVALEVGDGTKKIALDVYTNVLIHSNARIATSQGFYTASVRGSSGLVTNPTPAATPATPPSTLLRDDPPPKTAVDWGWRGNKKAKKKKP